MADQAGNAIHMFAKTIRRHAVQPDGREGEAKMLTEVIIQAFRDIYVNARTAERKAPLLKAEAADAKRFIKSKGFNTYCESVGLEPEWVLDLAKPLLTPEKTQSRIDFLRCEQRQVASI